MTELCKLFNHDDKVLDSPAHARDSIPDWRLEVARNQTPEIGVGTTGCGVRCN